MPRFKENNRKQSIMIPLFLENQLIPGTIEHSIDYLVDNTLDLRPLISDYNNEANGAPAYPPGPLLKVLFLAFIRGIYSSRKIERVCRENMIFMALSSDLKPDHATIARFINRLSTHIEELFQNILLYCDSLDLLSGTYLAIDGCKISSNAAKDCSGTFAELEKKKQRFQAVCVELIKRSKTESEDDLKNRIEKYQKKIDRIDQFLSRNNKRIGYRNKEVKSNITDNQSAKLTGNHGVIQGYYALLAADEKNQIITSAKAVGTQNEAHYLKTLIESSHCALPARITRNTTILADTGYFTESNCQYLFNAGQKAVIPDNHFRQRDPRFHREGNKDVNSRREGRRLYDHDKFRYKADGNYYICPAEKELRYEGKTTMHGHKGRRYMQKDGHCQFCHLKSECLQKNSRTRHLFIVDVPRKMTYSEKMRKIIDSRQGRLDYSRRMGIVEPVFGNITYNKKAYRFNYRGKVKVNTIWKLQCMVHNIEKIHNYGKRE